MLKIKEQPVAVPNVVAIKDENNKAKYELVSLDKILPPPIVSHENHPTTDQNTDSDEEVTFVKAERIRRPTENPLQKEMLETLKSVPQKSGSSNNDPLVDFEEPEQTDFPCTKCRKIFSTAKHLEEHMEGHVKGRRRKKGADNEKRPFQCAYCPLIFEKQVSLAAHYHCHKEELKEKNIVCAECGEKFTSKGSLWHHRKMNHISEIHKCKLCPKTFAKKVMYDRHMQHHAEQGLIVCDICGKSFSMKNTLQIHMRIHSGERPFLCSDCGKSFATNQRLQEHQRRHKGETRHACPICGKLFYEKSELKKHSYSHTDDKPHACDVCGKGFILPNRLREHKRTHTGEKPFVCNFDPDCNKCFTNLTQLKRHILGVHKGEKPFKCEICGRAFLDKGCLKTHIQRLHGVDKMNSGFECTFENCGMEFKTMRKLTLHLEQQHR